MQRNQLHEDSLYLKEMRTGKMWRHQLREGNLYIKEMRNKTEETRLAIYDKVLHCKT